MAILNQGISKIKKIIIIQTILHLYYYFTNWYFLINNRIPFQAQPKLKFPDLSCLNGIAKRPPISPTNFANKKTKTKYCDRSIANYKTAYINRKVRICRKTYITQREKIPGAKRQKKKTIYQISPWGFILWSLKAWNLLTCGYFFLGRCED